MNIETLLVTPGQSVAANGQSAAASEESAEGDFDQLIAALTGEIADRTGQATTLPDADANTDRAAWLTELLTAIGYKPTPDPTGEASLLTSAATSEMENDPSASLTEILAALQSMLGQDTAAPHSAGLNDETSGKAEAATALEETKDDDQVDLATLNSVLSLLSPGQHHSDAGQPATPASAPTSSPAIGEAKAITGVAGSSSAGAQFMPPVSDTDGSSGDPTARRAGVAGSVADPSSSASSAPAGANAGQGMRDAATAGLHTLPSSERVVTPEAATFGPSFADLIANDSPTPNGVTNRSAAGDATYAAGAVAETSASPGAKRDGSQVELPTPGAQPVASTTMATISPVADTAPVEAAPDIPALRQIVDTIGLVGWKGKTEVRMHLHPESLGRLLVTMHVADGDVSVQMLAETSQAHTLIQNHLPQLKADLAAQGLQVDGLTVAVGGDSSAFDAPSRQPAPWAHGPAHQRADASPDDVSAADTRLTSRPWSSLHAVDYHV